MSKTIIQSLKDFTQTLPTNPGVYFFKDENSKIIYIGKAKNLKVRVKSYFNKSNNDDKSIVMISKTKYIDYMVVDTEVEALITEANLIKQHQPKYNIFLKDDKTFPYIQITNEDYPKVQIIRKKRLVKDGNIYFGPYTDVGYLREILKTLHNIFPIKTCQDSNIKKMQRCFCGFCLENKKITKNEYSEVIKNVIYFLNGKNNKIRNILNYKMNESSKRFEYEDALRYRNQLIAIDKFYSKQKQVSYKFYNIDVINVSIENLYGIGVILRIRNGLLIGKEKFDIKFNIKDQLNSILTSFLTQYYSSTFDFPQEIVVSEIIQDKKEIQQFIYGIINKNISIKTPERGFKKNMLDLCIKNSKLYLKELIVSKINRNEYLPTTLKELQDVLSLQVLPKRIEAFDNSNLNGSNPVAAMVCFKNGKPFKKEYRKFHIKTVKGIDDYESMREVVYRRYKRQIKDKAILPDLILIDGGKGQLSAAKDALEKLDLGFIPVIGLAKRLEEVFIPESSEPQNISKTSPVLYLLRSIRDEVHRFAISFHKETRKKDFFNSKFDNIKGLGKKRINTIWNNYDSFEQIAAESAESIHLKTKIPFNICKRLSSLLSS